MSESVLSQGSWHDKDLSAEKKEVLERLALNGEHGPGPFLREMREFMGYTVAETASRLGIDVPQVNALEDNDYDNLPAPIFVRNYIRRYAEFTELPLEPVLQSYEKVAVVEEPDLNRVSLRESINSRSDSVRWVSFAVIALTLVLVVVWWQSQKPVTSQEPVVVEPHSSEPAEINAIPLAIPQQGGLSDN